jgi:hypothetical protein
LVTVGPLTLQHESHTKQEQDLKKKWLVLEVVRSTKTISNELQCNCDRTHMTSNEEFVVVTICLHRHIVSVICMENSHVEKETIPSGTLTILGDS